ncbi:transglutaminase domain-containing protein [Armatimonas rosea]|uniref:Transglutaminase-like putative cysteine protease n=1 Tax=Armatimonas rosea TaxID=685828 RepID=A0A7W9W571_ARMRO|nr:transglutaminase-like putative cysteine protease [Armatimonas rosea]
MIYRICHSTEYRYPGLVRNSHNELRLKPLSDLWQTCRRFELRVEPEARLFSYELPGGAVHHFSHRLPHHSLRIVAESEVESCKNNPFSHLDLITDDSPFYLQPSLYNNFCEYLDPTERVPNHRYIQLECEQIAASARQEVLSCSTAAFLVALTKLLHREFRYEPGSTHVHTKIEEIFIYRRGVCQDFAQVMLAVCRSQGIPARYVSGYLYTGHNGLVSNDATHAWVECLLPDGSWHGFDPTNDMVVNDAYIRTHTGRDYSDVAPVRGLYQGPPASKLDVVVTVERIDE